MKKALHIITISTILILAMAVMQPVYAGSGAPGGPIQCILVLGGEPLNVAGTVAECCLGQGLLVDTGSELVTLYGLGPIWYWEQMGVDRPVIGDQVESDTRSVTFSDGTTRLVMMSVLVNGVNVQLRDPSTGCPLWR